MLHHLPSILAATVFLSALSAHGASINVSGVTGATVDESNLATFVASATQGNDSNPGSAEKPFKTLTRAFESVKQNLVAGVGTRLLIMPGIYRDFGVTIDGKELGGKATETTLVIESGLDAAVDWRGSVVRKDWRATKDGRNIYRLPWTAEWGDIEAGPVKDHMQSDNPSSPQDLAPVLLTGAKPLLQWKEPKNGKSYGYHIYRGIPQKDENFVRLTSQPLTDTRYPVDKFPDPNTEFVYYATSVDENGKELGASNRVRIGWGIPMLPNLLGRRLEMVFMNGDLYRPVATREELGVGTFWVDDGMPGVASDGAIYLQIPMGHNIRSFESEVAGHGTDVPHLYAKNMNSLVVRGIRFMHSGTHPWYYGALSISRCHNVLLEGNEFSWNSGNGLHVDNTDRLTIRNNLSSDNGGSGISGAAGRNHLWEDNRCLRNGWRGTTLGGQDAFFHAGLKFGFGQRDAIFRNNRINDNEGMGFWLDTDMSNILVEDLVANGNRRAGIVLEGARGPVVIRNSTTIGNRQHGVRLGDVGGVLLESNTIVDNTPDQICVGVHMMDGKPGRPGKDFYTKELYHTLPIDITWKDNTVAALRTDQSLVSLEWGGFLSYLEFYKHLRASGNQYWHPSKRHVFPSPLPKSIIKIDLDQWSQIVGGGTPQDTKELGTVWEKPQIDQIH